MNRLPMKIQTLHLAARRIIQQPTLRIHFSSMSDKGQPSFSQGEDEKHMMAETTALLESKWSLDETRQGLEKTFTFPTYAKALVSHFIPHRDVAETHTGFYTPDRCGNQAAKPPS